MNSPRERFLSMAGLAEQWNAIVKSIPFEEAADAAMLQLTEHMPVENAGYMIKGAKEFLKILSTLGHEHLPAKKQKTGLNYDIPATPQFNKT